MKNKIFALFTAAVVGVMGFTPVMSARAANLWEDICPKCGEYSIIAVKNASKIRTMGQGPCQKDYDHQDNQKQNWVRMNYYCADCNIHWENWVPGGGPYWECP